jgi:hypothetical protein
MSYMVHLTASHYFVVNAYKALGGCIRIRLPIRAFSAPLYRQALHPWLWYRGKVWQSNESYPLDMRTAH